MRISLSLNVFARRCGDDAIFVNPRTAAAAHIVGVGNLVDALNQGDVVLSEFVNKQERVFGFGEGDLEHEYDQIIDALNELKLIELEKVSENSLSCVIDYVAELDVFKREEREYPVTNFYKQGGMPQDLHLDLTSACTERCVHCYLPEYPNKHLPFPVVEKVLCEFREMQGLTVYLTGGECMLHPDFKKICRLCKDLDLNMIIMSNMTLCDKEMVSFLREMDPQFVNVSLYSMNPEEHDAMTQVKGSWRKTMDAILACEEAGVHIRIATPLLKINRNAYGALKKFTDEHRMHLIPDFSICPKSNHDACNLDYACNAKELEAVLTEYKEFFDQGFEGSRRIAGDDRVCEIGDFRLCLNSKGEYYPCDGMHGYVLGNVYENTLEEVWHGEKLEALRKLRNRDFGTCVSCEHRAFCKVCPAYNFNATGSLTETILQHCETARIVHKVYGGM